MSEKSRFQVFVSSTFTDLVSERAEVIQALWELDCIPTGMEAFVASNESQWEVIKKVIDDSDYYVLIIGGRYGSVTDEGVSYTEKEFQYAKKVGLPILAFVHADPESIPMGKSETSPENQKRLAAFRKAIMDHYPIGKWSTALELGSVVSRSVVREIRATPRPGWIRSDGQSRIELLEKIAELTAENQTLRTSIDDGQDIEPDETLEQGEDEVHVWGTRTVKTDWLNTTVVEWEVNSTWEEIFRDMGPLLLSEATEDDLKRIVANYNYVVKDTEHRDIVSPRVADAAWADILIQLRALGLMEAGTKKRPISDKGRYWKLTKRGDNYLVSLLAKRRTS